MILVAVIVGYILGVLPHVLPKILVMFENKKAVKAEVKENKEQQEILDEWLNGPKQKNEVNQADIYKEYVTGIETVKGG